jgi:hypothetical protein
MVVIASVVPSRVDAYFSARMNGARSIGAPPGALPAAGLAAAVGWLLVAPGFAVAMAVAVAPGVIALWLHPRGREAAFGIALAAVPVISGVAAATTSAGAPLRRVDDVVLVLGLLALASQWRLFPVACRRPALAAFAALAASEIAGLAGGWTSPLVTLGAAWQDIRWLGAIGLGLALGYRMTRADCRKASLALLAAWSSLNLTVAIVQIASRSLEEHRLGLPVVPGAFGHPTFGAIAGTCLLLYVAADRLSPRRRITDAGAIVLGLLALSNIVISVRFKALLSIAIAMIFLLLQGRHRRKPLVAAAFAAVPLLVVPLIGLSQQLSAGSAAGQQSFLADTASHAAPRLSLMNGAKRLAAEHFPLGSGLGSFGSNLDPQLEDVTFNEAGIGDLYGFSQQESAFRSDSQVAHTLAERGYLGIALWVLGLSLVLVAAVRLPGASLYPATALVAAISAVAVSPSLISGPAIYIYLLPAGLELAAGLRDPPG